MGLASPAFALFSYTNITEEGSRSHHSLKLVIRHLGKKEGEVGNSEEVRPLAWKVRGAVRTRGSKKGKDTQHVGKMGTKGESGQI